MSNKLLKMPRDISLEELKKNPMLKGTSDKNIELIWRSAKRASSYVSSQEIPKEPNPLKLAKWYRKEIEEYTAEIDKVEKECDMECVCCKGCAACCKQLIAITSTEFVAMQVAIDNLPNNTRKSIKENVGEQCKKLIENGITNSEINKYISDHEALQLKYFELDMKCPLLDENNACIIYDVRPFNCWTYRNYGSSKMCEQMALSDDAIKFDDWEHLGLERMLQARRPKAGLLILQFALNDYLK